MKTLDKALVIACAGKTAQSLAETGEKAAMETVMLGDRIRDRANEKEMVIFDGITHWDEPLRDQLAPAHLKSCLLYTSWRAPSCPRAVRPRP